VIAVVRAAVALLATGLSAVAEVVHRLTSVAAAAITAGHVHATTTAGHLSIATYKFTTLDYCKKHHISDTRLFLLTVVFKTIKIASLGLGSFAPSS
jgi:hypothetical protein